MHKGLERVRVIVEPNEWGIELDAVYDGFSEAHLESRHFDRQFTRVTFDSTRFAQVGSWTGHPQGRRPRASSSPPTASGGRGTARGGSARWASPSPRASGPPIPAGGFFWIYAPVRFEDHAMVTIIQERPSGERIMQDAHRVFPLGSGRAGRVAGPARAPAPVRPGQPAR